MKILTNKELNGRHEAVLVSGFSKSHVKSIKVVIVIKGNEYLTHLEVKCMNVILKTIYLSEAIGAYNSIN